MFTRGMSPIPKPKARSTMSTTDELLANVEP